MPLMFQFLLSNTLSRTSDCASYSQNQVSIFNPHALLEPTYSVHLATLTCQCPLLIFFKITVIS